MRTQNKAMFNGGIATSLHLTFPKRSVHGTVIESAGGGTRGRYCFSVSMEAVLHRLVARQKQHQIDNH